MGSNPRRLVREGLVALERRLTSDGFRTFARLTPEGVEAYRELARFLEAALAKALGPSGPGEGSPRGDEPGEGVGGH